MDFLGSHHSGMGMNLGLNLELKLRKQMTWLGDLVLLLRSARVEWLTSVQKNAFSLKQGSIGQNCTRENGNN